ncbi:MAG: serine/threonine protein kinase [Candidatus Riflebacteria bacterium]|nr:serine/threonine protein kinase [Candidatus Riflebacteria bacterium]
MARRKSHENKPRQDVDALWGKALPHGFPVAKTIKRQPGTSASPTAAPDGPAPSPTTTDAVAANSGLPDLPAFIVARPTDGATPSPVHYRIGEKLGEGGMGAVFCGTQVSIGREVAVKVLRPDFLADRDAIRRFVCEGQITGRLDHPNILPILDLGRTPQGDLFIAMKKITGSRWDQTFSSKKPRENLEILLRACDAIAYAHSRGFIHRDIKPENVMLGEFGEIIITDWGLASPLVRTNDGTAAVDEDIQAGTPAYMAPEVAICDAAAIGERTDVYLLGATLFEVWTGKSPHAGKDVYECLAAAAENRIQPVDQADEIVEIARRAMATDPDDRYPSVRAFQEAIQDYLSHLDSLTLTRSAKEEGAGADGHYSRLSRSLVLYEEALKLWEGNAEARNGVTQARLQFAAAALSRGDLNLGESLLLPDCPEHQEMRSRIHDAQRTRQQRRRRLTIVSVVFMGFALTLIVLILNMKARLESDRDAALAACQRLLQERAAPPRGP